MQSTLKPKQTDDPHDIVVVAPAASVAPADDELSSLLHDAARRLSQAQARAASEVPAGAAVPPVDTTFRPAAGNAAVNNVLVTGRLRSIGRGAMRAFAAVLLATCIGVAGLAWQPYGDAAQQTIADWMPQLALTSLLPAEQPAHRRNRRRLPLSLIRRHHMHLHLHNRRLRPRPRRKSSRRAPPPCLPKPRSRCSRWRAISQAWGRRLPSSRPASSSSRPASNKCPATLPKLRRPKLPRSKLPSKTCGPG